MDDQLSTSWLSSTSTSLEPSNSPAPAMEESSMPLPPEAIYSSSKELYTAIQAFARQHCYAFSIGRSRLINKGPRKTITYNCDRYGPTLPANNPQDSLITRKRCTSTCKTGCEFSINAVQVDENHWELRHRPDPKHSQHNHPPSRSATSHSIHRQLTQDGKARAQELHNAGRT